MFRVTFSLDFNVLKKKCLVFDLLKQVNLIILEFTEVIIII